MLKGEAIAKPKRGRVLRKLLIVPLIAAVGAAVFAALRSRAPKEDPWAVPTGTYPAYTPPAPAGAASSAASDLDSGGAADALDSDGAAQVPGLTVDSSETPSTSPEPNDPTAPTENH